MQKNVRPINTMFKNKLFLLLVFFAMARVHAQDGIGVFEGNLDVGTVRHNGAVFYDSNTQKYVVRASGANMWGDTDNFHYLWRSIQGDFIIRAQVEFLGPGVNEHRKLGLTVRNGLHSGAAMVNATVHGGDGLTSLQYRLADDDETKEVQSADNAPTVIQLERRGNLFIMSTATFGVPLTSVQQEVSLNNEVYVGLSLCSHDADVVETAIFKNVRIIKPVKEDYVAYNDYLGSRLEIMDVITGDRKVLLNSAHSIQAPNWTVDGKLIYNSNGMLYTYDQQNGKVEMIQTGFATRNNNDHVLSFDGKYLGISHHDGEDNGDSAIYYMPVGGSTTPVRVTQKGLGASYLHGWSADGKKMVFTGRRNGKYDLYQVDILTQKEKQLTDTAGLDDGSEYAPDGEQIYFNSDRTGTMQIWKMKANGKDQTQLTFDQWHDWFPHVSPDGTKLLWISFPKEVASNDHPFYKHCLLRSMPIGGGQPKVVAYIYGGQGSINVPSWSPDGRYVAFVTNSD